MQILPRAALTLAVARNIIESDGPEALHALVLERAGSSDDNSIIGVDADAGWSIEGPLSGIPFGVKDNIDSLPFATTGGSPGLTDYFPATDAPAVARLKAAGGYVPVKLSLHELAFGITSNNSHAGPVRNPYDPKRVAGGSSGGNAAAVARSVIPFALGTDTGGSTRIPAAFCGIAGFRPSTGRYPSGGVLTLSTTRDTIGPMAVDCSDLLEIDGLIVPEEQGVPVIARRLRIGLLNASAGLSLQTDAAFGKAILALEAAGVADFVPLDVPAFADLDERMGHAIVFNEAADVWERFCREKRGLSLSAFAELIASPDVRHVFGSLEHLALETRPAFERAVHGGLLGALRKDYADLFSANGLDLIAMPTSPVPPPFIGEDMTMATDLGLKSTFDTVARNTALATLTGAPSLSIPAGLDAGGLPVGLMIEGRPGEDRFVLAAGARIESVLKGLI
ncbi:amidase family protein [Rhizobium sp. FY34]|uniref:amidase family protein n=1 Tax=Rhizobium sp. FY34 TaxID=2562309 RepID=UPI001485B025|nr:amidase family protein [Rhizobium sp. FY34]